MSQQTVDEQSTIALAPGLALPVIPGTACKSSAGFRLDCLAGTHYESWVKRSENCSAAPQGATAQCRDETYSFSKSRRGTSSHHAGVVKWLWSQNLHHELHLMTAALEQI